MTESLNGVVVSFECPVCENTVELEETSQHNLHHSRGNHGPSFGDESHDCPVYFSRDESLIRNEYDFIQYEVPIVFTTTEETESDPDVLDKAIDGVIEQALGGTVWSGLESHLSGKIWIGHQRRLAFPVLGDLLSRARKRSSCIQAFHFHPDGPAALGIAFGIRIAAEQSFSETELRLIVL